MLSLSAFLCEFVSSAVPGALLWLNWRSFFSCLFFVHIHRPPHGPRPTLSPSHVVLAPAMCDDRLCPALYSDQLWCSSIRIPFQSVGSNWGRDSLWLYCFGSDQRAVPSFRCCQSQIGFQTAILPRPPPPPLVSSSPVPFTPSISLIRWVQHTLLIPAICHVAVRELFGRRLLYLS